jgi:peptidoglycan L-alanyl-D-glutamate endopeptidase CwlK
LTYNKDILFRFVIINFVLLTFLGCNNQFASTDAQPCPACPLCPEVKPLVEEPTEIVDSDISLEEALMGIEIPSGIRDQLTIIDVKYIGYDRRRHKGQLVCNRSVAGDLSLVFEKMYRDSFPIAKVIPVVKYNWSDSLSMVDNNTSCFNFRLVEGGYSYSQHSYGRAVDINPRNNPYYIGGDTLCLPVDGVYDTLQAGTIAPLSNVVRYFRALGWQWGGAWRGQKDYQHFSRYGG